MIVRSNGYKYYNYYLWNKTKNEPYDYAKKGLVRHILSNVIVDADNEVLKNVLKYFENTLVFLMKYVDELKHFKNIHRFNR